MVKKDFLIAMGDRNVAPTDTDALLASKVNERKRREIERQEEKDEAKHEADMAKYKKDASSAEAAAGKAGEKKEESGGFKITGGVDVGHINLQEERQAAMMETERLRKEAADNANRTAQENAQLRADLHAAEMREMKAEHAAALELIKDKIDNRSPMEIMRDIRASAAELGLKEPDPGVTDPMVQVRLMEMEHAEAARAREFEWKMKQDEYAREDKKEELREQRAYNQAKLAQDKEKSDYFKSLPQQLTEAFAKGMAASPGDEAPAVPSGNIKQRGELTAPVGVGGKTQCPTCGTEVGVGPTARKAVCVNCETEIVIKRVKSNESAQPIAGAESAANSPEEDE